MITYTNNHDVPTSIENAIRNNDHFVHGDISVTQLLDSPQVRILKRNNDTEKDVMSMMWVLIHSALRDAVAAGDNGSDEAHKLIQASSVLVKNNETREVGEWVLNHVKKTYNLNDNILRDYTTVAEVDGWSVYGVVDRYLKDEKKIQLYKVCTVWDYIYPENKKKWIGEINVLAFLLRSEGFEVETAEVVALFKDYSQSSVNKDYPKHPLMTIPVVIHEDKVVQKIVAKKVSIHKSAAQGSVPECTEKERWHETEKWKVMLTPTSIRASKVFGTEIEAEAYNLDKKGGLAFVKYHPGTDKRCEKYCSVSHLCPQWKRRLKFLSEQSDK